MGKAVRPPASGSKASDKGGQLPYRIEPYPDLARGGQQEQASKPGWRGKP